MIVSGEPQVSTEKWMMAGFYIAAFFSAISISYSQIGLGIVLISWIIMMIKEKRVIFVKNNLSLPILIYVGTLFISSFFAIDPLRNIISVHHVWVVLMLFALITFIRDLNTVKSLIYTMFGGTAMAAIYGIAQAYLGGFDLVRPEGKKIISHDAIGFFNNHLTYGGVLLFTVILSLSLFLLKVYYRRDGENGQIRFEISSYVTIFVLATTALLLSYTRSSWVGFLGGLVFMGALTKERGLRITLVVILLSFVAILSHSHFKTRAFSIMNAASHIEKDPRYFIWQVGMETFRKNPIFGVGPDNWTDATKMYRNVMPVIETHAHNNLIYQAATGGIIGLAAFLYIWVVLFKDAFCIYRDTSDNNYFVKALLLGGIGGIVGFHVAGMFECNFLDSEVVMVLWFITGLIYVAGASLKDKSI